MVDATAEVENLLASVTLNDCFDPTLWPQLVGFALVEPEGDILPVRASYDGRGWGIGVNPLTSTEPLWYSIADCVAGLGPADRSPAPGALGDRADSCRADEAPEGSPAPGERSR